jgi:hypothetical protein
MFFKYVSRDFSHYINPGTLQWGFSSRYCFRCCQEMTELSLLFTLCIFNQTDISAAAGLNYFEVAVFLFNSVVGELYTPL